MALHTSEARHHARLAAAVLTALLGAACSAPAWPPECIIDIAIDVDIDGEHVDEVDLLLMIDDSSSMAGEQALLVAELPRMIRMLAAGDADDDGVQDFSPVRSLHLGVVTSDMGAGPAVPAGETVPSCERGLGGDGILLTAGATAIPGCVASYPPVFDFGPPGDPAAFARDVGCVALVGSRGCGFEQQLEATLKAVSASSPTADYVPSGYLPPVFAGGTPGHGDNANVGFIRRGSVLALVLLTDEEDCSVPDYSIFYRDDRFSSVGLNLRCFAFPDELYPTERYVQNLAQLRSLPGRLVFAAIAGVPLDRTGDTVADYDATLVDPRMIETPDPSTTPPTRLLSSCRTADGGEAFPPRRIVEVARGLSARGARTTIQSICAADFRAAFTRIVELVSDALGSGCLPRPLDVGPDGRVDCGLMELLPPVGSDAPVTHCAEVPGAELVVAWTDDLGVTREECRITQLTADEARLGADAPPGWYYDTSEEVVARCSGSYPPGQQISISPAHTLPRGAVFALDCEPGASEPARIGTHCDPALTTGPGNLCARGPVPSHAPGEFLACNAVTRSCAVRCSSDADCARAGLDAWLCDRRPVREVTEVPSDPASPYDFCFDPTCPVDSGW